jgi:hypothetical protein
VEFSSDAHTDKGPCTGAITAAKITVDGLYVRIKHSDVERQFSWDDISKDAEFRNGCWFLKSIPMDVYRRADEPTPEQLKSGEYPKRRMEWRGLTIAIENEAGHVRRGTNRDGVTWEIRMKFAYGEILGTRGVDGDPVDVFIGPMMDDAPMVYVVHARKVNRWDQYDEDKCMAGFMSEDDARAAFLSCYNDARFLGDVTAMPVEEFVAKVRATENRPAMIKALFFFSPVAY